MFYVTDATMRLVWYELSARSRSRGHVESKADARTKILIRVLATMVA